MRGLRAMVAIIHTNTLDALAKSRHRYFLSFSSGLQTILNGIKIDSRANGELAFLSNPDFLAGSDFLRGHHTLNSISHA